MSKRFKLVFLTENEEYLTDVGCTVDARRLGTAPAEITSLPGSISRLVKSGGFRGRLRVASKSIYLDLEVIVCIHVQLFIIFTGRVHSGPLRFHLAYSPRETRLRTM